MNIAKNVAFTAGVDMGVPSLVLWVNQSVNGLGYATITPTCVNTGGNVYSVAYVASMTDFDYWMTKIGADGAVTQYFNYYGMPLIASTVGGGGAEIDYDLVSNAVWTATQGMYLVGTVAQDSTLNNLVGSYVIPNNTGIASIANTWGADKAGYLAATVAPAITALSNAVYTDTKAGFLAATIGGAVTVDYDQIATYVWAAPKGMYLVGTVAQESTLNNLVGSYVLPLTVAGYTAPDNTGIASIYNRVNAIPLTATISGVVDANLISIIGTTIESVVDVSTLSTQTSVDSIASAIYLVPTLSSNAVWTATQGKYLVGTVAQDSTLNNLVGSYILPDNTGIASIYNRVNVIPITPLLAGSYTAPDNIGIASIYNRVNTIPITPLLAGSYTAPDNTGIASIYNRVNNIPLTPLLAASYTAPNNTGIASIANTWGADKAAYLNATVAPAITALSNTVYTDEKAGFLAATIGGAVTVDYDQIANTVWTATQGRYVAATVAPANTALSNTVYTDEKAGFLAATIGTADVTIDYTQVRDAVWSATKGMYLVGTVAQDSTLNNLVGSYILPDNTGIASIYNRVNVIPTDPVRIGSYIVPLTVAGYTAPDNAGIASVYNRVNAIPTNPLLSTNYTAPDNTGIASIYNRVNSIPTDPVRIGSYIVPLTVASYTAPDNVGIASIANTWTAQKAGYLVGTTPLGLEWNTMRASYLDASITSRLAAADYSEAVGNGSQIKPYTVVDGNGAGIPAVLCNFTSDYAGLNSVVTGYTNGYGVLTVALNVGTYHVYRSHPNYTFVNPDVESIP